MIALLRCLMVALALTASLVPPAVAGSKGPGVRVDPNFPPLGGSSRGSSRGVYRDGYSRGYGDGYYRRSQRPQIYCDGYGECFQRVPGRSRSFGSRPRGWDDDLPHPNRYSDRF